MLRGIARKLELAQQSQTLIRLERSLEQGFANGYVIATGSKWVLVAIVSDAILPAGYKAFRLTDISVFRDPAPHASFVEAALRLRSVRRPKPSKIDITNAQSILTTAHQEFELVTIHREIADPGVCHIGQLYSSNKNQVCLTEITCDAELESGSNCYSLSEITKIDFGGPYEAALASVGLNSTRKARSIEQW